MNSKDAYLSFKRVSLRNQKSVFSIPKADVLTLNYLKITYKHLYLK